MLNQQPVEDDEHPVYLFDYIQPCLHQKTPAAGVRYYPQRLNGCRGVRTVVNCHNRAIGGKP
jgi:hypothetical protein